MNQTTDLGKDLALADGAKTLGIILSYHRIAELQLDPWGLRVSAENFSQQLSILREFGSPTGLTEFAGSIPDDSASNVALMVTFDDGYFDNLSRALPLLNCYQIPATVFVSTGAIGRPYFWWEVLEYVFLRPNQLPNLLTLDLDDDPRIWDLGGAAIYSEEAYLHDCKSFVWRGTPGSRVRLYHQVYEALWPVEHDARLDLVDQIVSWASLEPRHNENARPMTEGELQTLGKEERVTIGAHTVHHLPLEGKATAVQESEIVDGREALEALLGEPVSTFAYPHGKFDAETVGILSTHGFQAACTTQHGTIDPATDPLLLPRYAVQDWNRDEFREKLEEWT